MTIGLFSAAATQTHKNHSRSRFLPYILQFSAPPPEAIRSGIVYCHVSGYNGA